MTEEKRYKYSELDKEHKPSFLYIPDDEYDDMGDSLNYDVGYSPFDEIKTDDFHLRDVEKKVICKYCGNDKFEVGTGKYFTGLRCTNCKWEKCVHEG